MNYKYLYLIFFTLIILSCHSVKVAKTTTVTEKSSLIFNAKYLIPDSNTTSRIECDEFVSNALNFYTIKSIAKDYPKDLKCSKDLYVNMHDSTVIDTIYTYSNTKNKIQFYRAKLNDYLFKFDVTDSIYILNGNIKTGMTKDAFTKKFIVDKITNNKVQITNAEGSIRLTFFFENNLLKRIHSYLYLD